MFFLLTFVIGAIVVGKRTEEISNWWSVVASIVNVLTIAVLIFTVKKQNSSYWELINYQKGKTTWKQIVGMSVIIVVIGMVGMYLAGYICYGVKHISAVLALRPAGYLLKPIDQQRLFDTIKEALIEI